MSITTWTRIEPDNLTGDPQRDLAEGLAAHLADPLWMLGRQWQTGELEGEDAGSPVAVQITARSFAIERLDAPPRSTPYQVANTPVDAIVEHDGAPADLHLRATGGRTFLDTLAENNLPYGTAARSAYAFGPFADASLLDQFFVHASGVDGDRVLADAAAGRLATQLGVKTEHVSAFTTAAGEWMVWYAPRATVAPNPAWQPDHLEYKFSMSAQVDEGRVALQANEHNGGRIDWDSFSASPFTPAAGALPKVTNSKAMPLLLQIPGMPSPWFWEIEDPAFDAGRIEAGPVDTARLLLIEAALAYSTDWFLMPLRLPVASLSKIDSLQVTDTFGVTTIIQPASEVRPNAGWALWRVTQSAGGLPYLLLPPPNAGFVNGEPIEEVAMMRDEAANLAWALHTVPRSAARAPQSNTGPGDLIYVPMSPPPDTRTPLVLTGSGPDRFLVPGQMLDQPPADPTPLIANDFRLRDLSLPDEGLTLRRRFELGRTPDGVLRLWVSRSKAAGARMPAAGLKFDALDSGVGQMQR